MLAQMENYISNGILKGNVSACGKCHSTTTDLFAIKDDILRAMKRGEVTMAVFVAFLEGVRYRRVCGRVEKAAQYRVP